MPGGCDLGDRPIDQHLKAFNCLGASHSIDGGIVSLRAEELIGGQIYFDINTVGGTINAIFAAVKAKGLTIIENAAKEPHIVDLANFLNTMGADIMGAGTDVIKIRGVNFLKGVSYAIIPDQIEAGTYMVAAAATKGDVWIKNVIPKHLESITAKLRKVGATVEEYDECVHVFVDGPLLKPALKRCLIPASRRTCSRSFHHAYNCRRHQRCHRRYLRQPLQVCQRASQNGRGHHCRGHNSRNSGS